MAGVTLDEGRGRRLPQWMLGVKAADEVKRPNNGNEKSCLKKGVACQPCQPKALAETHNPEKAILLCDSTSSLPKCETKRTTRKSTMQDVDHDDEIIATVAEKKKYNKIGRNVRGKTSLEQKTTKRLKTERKEEFDISSPSDDDVELTVEDLMSIAEEYVQTEKEMEQQRSSSRTCGSESHRSVATSSRIGFRDSLDAPSNQDSCCSSETLLNERAVTKGSKSGDSTKDMLDLLLGPLLDKTLDQEKEAEFKAIDRAFSYGLKRQHQNDNVGEKMVPLMKKKSSLRDKIAMFLD